MAPHVYVDRLKDHVGQEVTLKGWLYNMAGKGKLAFLQVRDGTGIVQAVVSKADVGEEVCVTDSTPRSRTSRCSGTSTFASGSRVIARSRPRWITRSS